jgi:hypothetical protein
MVAATIVPTWSTGVGVMGVIVEIEHANEVINIPKTPNPIWLFIFIFSQSLDMWRYKIVLAVTLFQHD